MPLNQDLTNLCPSVLVVPGEICLRGPGGLQICYSAPDLIPPDPTEQVRTLFGQLNSALAPLGPIFNIIDAVTALGECIKAVATLNPEEIAKCIPGLAQQINKLLSLVPALSIPVLIIDTVDALIYYLNGLKNQLLRLKEYTDRIIAAETLAANPGNLKINAAAHCARDMLDNYVVNLNESSGAINRILGLVNFMGELAGLGCDVIPPFGAIDSAALDTALAIHDALVDTLTAIRNAIPIPSIPQLPDTGKPC